MTLPGDHAQRLFEAAVGHLNAGEAGQAEPLLRQALEADPGFADAPHILGLLAYQAGRLDEAAELIGRAIGIDGGQAAFHANLGAVFNSLGRYRKAEEACRRSLELDAKQPGAENNLAVSLDSQGQFDAAAAACERALKIAPDFADALVTLGNVRHHQGRLQDAVQLFRQAADKTPDKARPLTNLGVVLHLMGDLEAAVTACRQALEASPHSAEAHNALGSVLQAQGKSEDALQHFEQALALNPAYIEARLNRAACLFALGQAEAAETAYRRMLEDGLDQAEIHAGLGVVLLGRGQLDNAAARFRRAVLLKPTLASAWYDLAASRSELSDTERTQLQGLLDSDLPDADRVLLHFALADSIAKQGGGAAAAFDHYRLGNDLRRDVLKRQGVTFDADAFDAWVDAIIETFDEGYFKAHAGLGADTERPVFIVGLPRSGTSLVEQIAASHGAVFGGGELGQVADPAAFPDSALGLDETAARAWAGGILERFKAADDAQRKIDKTPFNFLYLGLLAVILPKARIIHCRRDPRDVGLSCYFQNFVAPHAWATDRGDIGRYIRAYEKLMAHWRAVLPLPMLEVVYEDLVADVEQGSRALIDFLGLPWDEACLDFHRNDRLVRTASNWQVRQPVYSSSVGRWRDYEEFLGPLLDGMGG